MSQPRRRRAEPLPEVVALLAPIREGFLKLHKALLDRERTAYEAKQGPVAGAMAFLKLAMEDPFFAWVRPFGQFIIQLDEGLETEAPLSLAGAQALLDQGRALLRSAEDGNEAERRYFAALQGDDGVAFLHADLKRMLNAASPPPPNAGA